MLDAFLDWLASLPALPAALVLMALSALENVFPPVPGGRRGRAGRVPRQAQRQLGRADGLPLLGRQHRLVRGALLLRARPRPRLASPGLDGAPHDAGRRGGARAGVRAARRLRHLHEPVPARRARRRHAVRGRRRHGSLEGAPAGFHRVGDLVRGARRRRLHARAQLGRGPPPRRHHEPRRWASSRWWSRWPAVGGSWRRRRRA